MNKLSSLRPTFGAVRCLVRYADAEQAILETQYTLHSIGANAADSDKLSVQLEVISTEGFREVEMIPHHAAKRHGMTRTELVHPDRWWPAGMGEQKLYTLTLTLLDAGVVLDEHSITIGVNSVRRGKSVAHQPAKYLLVNGQEFPVQQVIVVDEPDEQALLPLTGDTLVLVRGHYGPDLLYDAADRAGVLLCQCVPLDPEGEPTRDVACEVQRLLSHPSLVGWYVGHLGPLAEQTEHHLRQYDPQHPVFYRLPAA